MVQKEIYQTLADFFRSIGLSLETNEEMTVLDLDGLHGEDPIQSPSFRTNYYSFLLIETGSGSYKIDEHEFELTPLSFYFTTPGHLKSFNIEQPWTGYMITFTESFFHKFYHGEMTHDFPFLVNETVPVMQLTRDKFDELKENIRVMKMNYDQFSPYKYQIVIGHLSAFLFKTKELLLTHRISIAGNTRSIQIFNEFRQLVDRNMRDIMARKADNIKLVKEYAAELNVHPNHLSNTIKEESGKSANEWIKERTVSEIKGLLGNSQMSISEITHLFGFSSQTHFSRYFKTSSGQTPSQYRKAKSHS
ncbi:MAG: AraC family transcriptional regulator [Bacteroidota bacterium]